MLVLREVPRRGARLSAGVTAAETTSALAIAHTAAGGQVPSVAPLLAIAATSYGAGLLVLRRRTPIRVALPVLVVMQVVLHAWLVVLSGGHAHHHGPSGGPLLGLGWPMLVAHVAAGVAAAVAWALRRRAVDVLLAWTDERPVGIPHRQWTSTDRHPGHLTAWSVAAHPTRGPPRPDRVAA